MKLPAFFLRLSCLSFVAESAVLPPTARSKQEAATSTENEEDELSRLPQAIIIGVKKSGTRALLEYLRLNAAVRAPGPEVHFFDRHFDRGFDWYRRQMPPTRAEEMTVEKTPGYFVTRSAPERVAQLNPHTKLLVVVRNPVSRAISDYTQTASKRPELPPFEAMAFEASTGAVNASWAAIRIGLYERYVKRWLRHFPLAQLHFVSGERLISHPADEMALVERFLGLPPHISEDNFAFDSEKGFPCLRRTPQEAPPHCLARAILSSADEEMTFASICEWIELHFPFFRTYERNWRNGVRHTMSLKSCFVKSGKLQKGNGGYWAIDAAFLQQFRDGDYQHALCNRRKRLVAPRRERMPRLLKPHANSAAVAPTEEGSERLPPLEEALPFMTPLVYAYYSMLVTDVDLGLPLGTSQLDD